MEVKAFNVSDKEKKTMAVAWKDDGDAVFHDVCWKMVVGSVNDESNAVTLSSLERDMVMDAYKTAEYFDSLQKIPREGARIAQLLKQSKHAIAFTGAGISTSAGIGDFRGKSGKWTENDRKKLHGASSSKTKKFVGMENLRPTYTHEAMKKLMDMGHLRYIISQNTDSLHRLSGIPRDRISELHGNSFHELCEKCQTRFERPFARRRRIAGDVPPKPCPHCRIDHRTGRKCERQGCNGFLMNTIINFGDNLESQVLGRAEEQAKRNDMVLCLGTTLRVTPACDLVRMGVEPIRLIICNRQPTPFDKICHTIGKDGLQVGSRVYTDCDTLMREIMKHMLSADDLKDWEEGRESRMEEYGKLRK